MTGPDFPFVRNVAHSIGDLRDFEMRLSVARQQDKDLSKLWRVPNTKQMKEWCKIREETYPVKLLADHKHYSDNATFRLMPYGYPDVDAELIVGSERFNIQITIADPTWINEDGSTQNGGYDHRLVMEALNQSGLVHGSARMRRESGRIVSTLPVKSFEQEFEACRQGLVSAIERKFGRNKIGGRLLVHARGYEMHTMDFSLEDVARSAIEALGDKMAHSKFKAIWVVDQRNISVWP